MLICSLRWNSIPSDNFTSPCSGIATSAGFGLIGNRSFCRPDRFFELPRGEFFSGDQFAPAESMAVAVQISTPGPARSIGLEFVAGASNYWRSIGSSTLQHHKMSDAVVVLTISNLSYFGVGPRISANVNMAMAGEPTKGTKVDKVTLWGFYVSSCTWRVRLALGLKGIPYEYKALNISNGEHKSEEYKKISPLTYVPAVEVDGVAIADSMAIVEYFEEKYPDKRPLLPVDLVERAIVRQVMFLIGANIQPLQNLGTLKMIEAIAGADERLKWAQDHINMGFTALEQLLKKVAGKYTVGDELTLADVFLVPQIGNANRFKVDMTPYPTIDRLGKALLELPEVQASLPANQPDAPK